MILKKKYAMHLKNLNLSKWEMIMGKRAEHKKPTRAEKIKQANNRISTRKNAMIDEKKRRNYEKR